MREVLYSITICPAPKILRTVLQQLGSSVHISRLATQKKFKFSAALLGFSAMFPFRPAVDGVEWYEMERVIWALKHRDPLLSDLDILWSYSLWM